MTNNGMPRVSKFWIRVVHLLFIIFISYFVVQRTKPIFKIKKIRRFIPDIKHILLWHNIDGIKAEGQKQFQELRCQHTNCYMTLNRTLFKNLGYFDAILFSAQKISAGSNDLPHVRSSVQKYVFVTNDSADNYPVCDAIYDGFFNWTWTYKMDSTLPYTHFTVHNIEDENLGTHFRWNRNMTAIDTLMQNQLSSKSKAAAIFLDKCKSRSKREVYIANLQKELKKYNLEIDIFGNCGTKKCKKKTMVGCNWRLKKYYYFYLAMEDSISPYYITNEVLYGYDNNAVPVVYGGAQFGSFLPPNSYLNAMELNEEMLAREMNDIINKKTRYYDFFNWKNHYIIRRIKILNPCALCKALNNKDWLKLQARNFKFRKWWNSRYVERCAETRLWNYGMDKM